MYAFVEGGGYLSFWKEWYMHLQIWKSLISCMHALKVGFIVLWKEWLVYALTHVFVYFKQVWEVLAYDSLLRKLWYWSFINLFLHDIYIWAKYANDKIIFITLPDTFFLFNVKIANFKTKMALITRYSIGKVDGNTYLTNLILYWLIKINIKAS